MSVVMQQSPQPGVRERGCRTMSWRQQLINVNSPTLAGVDVELKGITDGTGRQVFPAGHSSTQQKFREEFERLPQVLEQAMRIYETALNQEIAGVGPEDRATAYRVVYRPGYAGTEAGVYATWAALMAFVATVSYPIHVQFDNSLAAITIPAGTHTFPEGTHFVGKFDVPFEPITIADGCVLEGVRTFEEGLSIINLSSSPVITLGGGTFHIITFQRGADINCQNGAPFVEITGAGTTGIVALYGGELIDGGASTPCISVTSGAVALINPVVASGIGANTLEVDGTSTMLIQLYGDTGYNSTQPDIVGTLIINYLDVAFRIGFDPTQASNQLVATVVQDAIDELTNKHVNSRSTAVSGAGTTALAAGGPKLVLVDMTGAGAGVRNIDLPDPAVDSGPWKIKRVDANGAATVNIRGTAGANVDGAASQPLGVSPASANLETDGTDWYRI